MDHHTFYPLALNMLPLCGRATQSEEPYFGEETMTYDATRNLFNQERNNPGFPSR